MKLFADRVVPPAFVMPIFPVVALLGTVRLSVVPPAPIVKVAGWLLFPNFTLVVPVNVLPLMTMWSPAFASFGAGSPVIVGRTFRVAGLLAVPFPFVALTLAVTALSGTVNWKLMSVTEPSATAIVPSLAVGSVPVPRKFEPLTVTTSPAW